MSAPVEMVAADLFLPAPRCKICGATNEPIKADWCSYCFGAWYEGARDEDEVLEHSLKDRAAASIRKQAGGSGA